MPKYRNVQTGREYDRPAEDKWLEASAGWERIDEPASEPADDYSVGGHELIAPGYGDNEKE